jgi:hypothetical protein
MLFDKGEVMTSTQTNFATIEALDLDPIKVKLMHKESGEGWSLEQANAVEFEYRRFLYLMKKFPRAGAAPRSDVDIFWHYHILDTLKYARDCEAVFGHFLHHFPYVGLRGEDDLALHERAGERMQELYEETFGERFAPGAVAKKATFAPAPGKTAYSWVPAPDKTASRQVMDTAYSWVVEPTPPGITTPQSMADTAYSFAVPPETTIGMPDVRPRLAAAAAH